MICTLVLLTLIVGSADSPLAVIRDAPDYQLTDQTGTEFDSRKQRGKVQLVSFVFTTCRGTCPATTLRMTQVHKEIAKRNLLHDRKRPRVQFVSISLDPARDTPEVLSDYMNNYRISPDTWSFLTGRDIDVSRVHRNWKMWTKITSDGQLDHPSRIFLIDKAGRIREVYNLAFLQPKWVAEDVALLLAEPAKPTQVNKHE